MILLWYKCSFLPLSHYSTGIYSIYPLGFCTSCGKPCLYFWVWIRLTILAVFTTPNSLMLIDTKSEISRLHDLWPVNSCVLALWHYQMHNITYWGFKFYCQFCKLSVIDCLCLRLAGINLDMKQRGISTLTERNLWQGQAHITKQKYGHLVEHDWFELAAVTKIYSGTSRNEGYW